MSIWKDKKVSRSGILNIQVLLFSWAKQGLGVFAMPETELIILFF